MLASTRLTALALAQKQHELSERVITAQWIRQEEGGIQGRRREPVRVDGWECYCEREREDSDARERASVHPAQLKAQGSCVCVVHACVRSNGDVGALIWAGLCAECVCRQHAIPIHREQRCLHEEHRRTAAEVKLSLDMHAHTYTWIQLALKGLPFIAAGMQRAVSGMFGWRQPLWFCWRGSLTCRL